MNIPALIYKTTPISIGKVLSRDRLFAMLQREPPTTAFWISGPGGSGKTTLIASYLAQENSPCLWYQVDAQDGDPATFFYYFGQAASSFLSPTEPPLPLLTPEYLPSIDLFIQKYFENFYRRLQPESWIVIDNFQNTPEGSFLPQILLTAIEQAPPHVTLAVLSRSIPPPKLARLQANQVLKPITGNLMTFTPDELDAFLAYYGHRISAEEAAKLHQLTRGWIAGAILWLLQQTDNPASLAVPVNRTPENIFDYFAVEILEKIDEETRSFLLQTAFLPSKTAAAAFELTNFAQAETLLETLYRKNCFLEKRLLPEVSYQYHPLFRDFLLHQAERHFDSADLRKIRCRAAEIMTRDGAVEEAVQLYFQAQAHDRIETIILSHAPTLINQGRHVLLLTWINQLPRRTVTRNPYLLFWQSVASLAMDPQESSMLSTQAYELFVQLNDIVGQVLSWSFAVNLLVLLRYNFSSLDKWITDGEQLGRLLSDSSPPELVGRFASGMLIALLLRDQSHKDFFFWQSRCETLFDQCRDPQGIVDLAKNLCWSYAWMGQMHKSFSLETRLRLLCDNAQIPPLGKIILTHSLAASYVTRGERKESQRMVNESLGIAEASGIHVFDFMIFANFSCIPLGTGSLDSMPSLLEKMKAALAPYALWDHGQYHILNAWYALQAGQLSLAAAEAENAVALAESCGSPFPVALCRVAQSQVHLERGELEYATAALEKVRSDLRLRNSKIIGWLVDLASADCALSQSRLAEAGLYLQAAFAFGREAGIGITYGLSNRRMGALSAWALEMRIEENTVIEFIKRWQLKPPEAMRVSERWPWPVRIYTLGRLAITLEETPLNLAAKTPRKPLELLALLVCVGQAGILREKLADRLWPDSEGDLALQNLNTTLHRIRKLLGNNEAVVQKGGQLMLNDRLCWIDGWHFQWHAQQLASIEGEPGAEKHIIRALQLYRGSFLPNYDQLGMVVGYASRLHRLWTEVVAAALPLFAREEIPATCMHEVAEALEDDETAVVAFILLVDRYKKDRRESEAFEILRRCRALLVRWGMADGHGTVRQIDTLLQQ